ncbi:SWIRM domain-containing protein FUN19 [Cladobotryum mycophilum]|uniref:SWIRM domain-containing protein FUN19 n=1 Tax=Cladobotryum mycophilum TaxID=491253 RepID=A0ABR0T3W0_9HYPO
MASLPNRAEQSIAPMASLQPGGTKKMLDISSLMSPPDPILDSFNQGNALDTVMAVHNVQTKSTPQPLPMSPPISPYTMTISSSNAPNTPPPQLMKDPVLYPIDESVPSSPPQPPLFAPTELEHHKQIIDEHVRRRSSVIFDHGVSPPLNEEYALALTFKSQVMKLYNKNRREWLNKERGYLREADMARRRFKSIAPAKPIAAKPVRIQRADRVSKPQGSAPRPIRTNVTGAPGLSPNGVHRPAVRRPSATPEPSKRQVAPNRDDRNFNALPDYCPPLSSLPNKSNSLKVDWKGQPIDLSKDEYRHLLHPDEIILAGNLRLDCATYLTSKRRMFERRLQCLRSNKEFRKTDAQQACKIDVNKASKLWTAFDKVGWLEARWVKDFK